MGRETWAKHVEQWRASGLTASQFEAASGINANTLLHWQWQLRGGQRLTPHKRPPRPTAPLAFVEVAPAQVATLVAPVGEVLERLEVVLPCGVRLRIPAGGCAPDVLRGVLAALEGR